MSISLPNVIAVVTGAAGGIGRAVVQQMKDAGATVIATDIGAPPETVLAEPAARDSQTTGWLVRSGDADALAVRLAEALALEPSARARIGERARRHAIANFSVEVMQLSTLGVYDRLLATQLKAQAGLDAPTPAL